MRTLLILWVLLGSWTAGGEARAATIESDLVVTEPQAPRWTGPDGVALPFVDDAQVVDFLRTATVISAKQLGKGINRPYKLLLDRDGVQAHAVFRRVDAHLQSYRAPGSTRVSSFRDSCFFEPAAYELGRMLGIHNIPPVVGRHYDGRDGTIQLWIENAFDEQARLEQGLSSPYPERWRRQRNVRQIFDALIHNIDRNRGNVLYDPDWTAWLIDHTRSFVAEPDIAAGKKIERCDRDLWQRLRTVDRQAVAAKLDPYLTRPELWALMVRWQKLVDHFEKLIAERGEGSVLF